MFQIITKELMSVLRPGDIFNVKVIISGEIFKFIFLKNKIFNKTFIVKIHTLKYLEQISVIYLYDNDHVFLIDILK